MNEPILSSLIIYLYKMENRKLGVDINSMHWMAEQFCPKVVD